METSNVSQKQASIHDTITDETISACREVPPVIVLVPTHHKGTLSFDTDRRINVVDAGPVFHARFLVTCAVTMNTHFIPHGVGHYPEQNARAYEKIVGDVRTVVSQRRDKPLFRAIDAGFGCADKILAKYASGRCFYCCEQPDTRTMSTDSYVLSICKHCNRSLFPEGPVACFICGTSTKGWIHDSRSLGMDMFYPINESWNPLYVPCRHVLCPKCAIMIVPVIFFCGASAYGKLLGSDMRVRRQGSVSVKVANGLVDNPVIRDLFLVGLSNALMLLHSSSHADYKEYTGEVLERRYPPPEYYNHELAKYTPK